MKSDELVIKNLTKKEKYWEEEFKELITNPKNLNLSFEGIGIAE